MRNLSTTEKYTLMGTLFGLLFPLTVSIGLSIQNNWNLIETQKNMGWTLWIIDTAPIFLGLFARIAGVRQEALEKIMSSAAIESPQKKSTISQNKLTSSLTLKNLQTNKISIFVGISTFLVCFLISLSMYLLLHSQEIKEKESYIEGRARSAIDLFKTQLSERLLALDRMAKRFHEPSKDEYLRWQEDAKAYYQNFMGFQAIEWADLNGKINWIYPLKGNEAAQGLTLNKELQRREAIQEARKLQQGVFTNPVELVQGGLGFLSIHPTGRKGINGFIIGVYRTDDVFTQLLDKNFRVAILMNKQLVYSQGFNAEEVHFMISNSDHKHDINSLHLKLRNKQFTLLIAPTLALSETFDRHHSISLLIILLLFSFLLAAFVARHHYVHRRVKQLLSEVNRTRTALDEVAAVSHFDHLGIIQSTNQKFLVMCKKSEQQIQGLPYSKFIHPEESDKIKESVWKKINSGKIWSGEIKCLANDGSYFWTNTSFVPQKNDYGIIEGFTEIQIDITDKKLAEEKIVKAKAVAENALETKTRFLANMSHEIRTPMNGIIGITSLLLNEPMNLNFRKNLEIIQNSGNTLLEIIDDILDFSKLEAGKTDFEKIPFNVKDCLNDIKKLTEIKASEKSVFVLTDLSKDTPEWFYGDQLKIRQILTNLTGNAIKFTYRGSVMIKLSAEKIDKENYILQFDVQDSGIGIPEEVLEKLFKPFSQVDASTTRKFGGTGLGLAISKGFIDIMGGKIWVNSVVGEGSTFSFSFPAQIALAQNDRKEINLDTHLAKEIPLRILVAEDNSTNQIVILGFLEKLGYKADLAANGLEVLEKLEHNTYDIIFMDCHMPLLDGFQTTRKIIAIYKNRPRIIALTASSMAEDRMKCKEAGMDGFLSKPVTPKKLIAELKYFDPSAEINTNTKEAG